MHLTLTLLIALTLNAAAPATKDAAPVKALGSCDESTTKGTCLEYTSFGFRTADDEKKVCEMGGGAWKAEACPTAKLLGSCETEGQIRRWYDAGGNAGLKPANVQDACSAMGGKYLPVP